MENKQLQIAKDTIAKKYGYANFEQFDDKSTFGYNHNTPKIIDEISIEYHRLMSEWVSVNERLPEIDEEYLLYVYDEDMEQYFHSVGYFEKSTKSFNTDLCIEMKFILFWKELPQPPK
jgi:hypothetical protein